MGCKTYLGLNLQHLQILIRFRYVRARAMSGNFNYFNQIQQQLHGGQQTQPQVMDPGRAMAAAKSASRAPSQVPPTNVIQYLPVNSPSGATQYYSANHNIGAWLQQAVAGQSQHTVPLQQQVSLES